MPHHETVYALADLGLVGVEQRHDLEAAAGEPVVAGEGVTEQVLEELVEDAYLRVMYSLPKAKRPIEFRERPVPEKR